MSLSKLEKLNRLFAHDMKPALPDRSKCHAVDQDLINVDDSLSHPNISSQQTQKVESSLAQVTKPSESVQVIVKPIEDTKHCDEFVEPISSSDESDDYVSAFKFRLIPKMRAQWRSQSMRPHSFSRTFAEKDQYGNPLVGVYCAIEMLAKFPYKFLEENASERVAKHFFNEGKFWERNEWTVYYLHVSDDQYDTKPLMLTPMASAQELVDRINTAFKSDLFIPTDPHDGLAIAFYKDSTPLPKHRGRVNSRDSFTAMKDLTDSPPPGYGKPPKGASPSVDRSFAAWNKKVQTVYQANRRKAKTLKKKKNGERLHQQQDWSRATRRAERYLGFRPVVRDDEDVDTLDTRTWEESEALRKRQELESGKVIPKLDVTKPAPYPFDLEPVIISVDIESNERNHSQITEIGISTLDTRDLRDLAPGKGAENWMKLVRSRHFRITEYSHITNTDFCAGAPNKFQFGTSEFVNLDHAAEAVDSCFRWPFSASFEHDGEFKSEDTEAKSKDINALSVGLDATKKLTISITEETTNEIPPISPVPLTPESTNGPSNDEQAAANEIAVTKILANNDSAAEATVRDVVEGVKKTASRANTISNVDEVSATATSSYEGSPTAIHEQPECRNIIFLGHDLGGDFTYLRKLGSTIFEPPSESSTEKDPIASPISSSIVEALDTALLFRVYNRETQSRSLAHILTTFGRTGWFLHCAGNDARYTLEAFLAMIVAMREKEDRGETVEAKQEWKDEVERRVTEKTREVEEGIRAEAGGWEVASDEAIAGDLEVTNGDTVTYTHPDTFLRTPADIDGGQPPRPWKQIAADIIAAGAEGKPRKKSGEEKKRADETWYYKGPGTAEGHGETGPATYEPEEEAAVEEIEVVGVERFEKW